MPAELHCASTSFRRRPYSAIRCSIWIFWSTPNVLTATVTIRSCARRLGLHCAGPCIIATTAASCSSSLSRCSFTAPAAFSHRFLLHVHFPPHPCQVGSDSLTDTHWLRSLLQARWQQNRCCESCLGRRRKSAVRCAARFRRPEMAWHDRERRPKINRLD